MFMQGNEEEFVELVNERRETYRTRRPKPTRRRVTRSKATIKSPSAPGGIRQRRNKHWNW